MNYVLSDIHGNLHNFSSILEQIQLTSDDSLYILGDVIDRFPHGIEILKMIMAMPNVHTLLGNHEYMMLEALGFPYEAEPLLDIFQVNKARQLWYHNGGKVTHREWKNSTAEEQKAMIRYLKALPLNLDIEVEGRKFKLVHGAVANYYDTYSVFIRENKAEFCVWDRDSVFNLADHEPFTIIFGHTPTANFQDRNPLEIFQYKNLIGIDCGSGWPAPDKSNPIQGRLACLRLEDMKEFYSA